ncbi:MAG: pilus assembly protein PilM [Planctomycetota bacterium]|nr:pilus assembly protein PilM [Planctomycetota bacterium]
MNRPWARTIHSPIGVDLGRRTVKAVQLVRAGDRWRVAAAAVYPRAAQDGPGGPAEEREIDRLCSVLERQGFVGRSIILAAPADQLAVEMLDLPPRSSGAPIDQIARAELARVTKLDPASFEMATWDLPAPARAGAGANLLAVALGREQAEACLDRYEARGLMVEALDTQAWAMARACALRATKSKAGSAVKGSTLTAAFDIGWSGALLVLLRDVGVIYQRSLAEGGIGELVADISKETGLSLDAVEQLLAEKSAPGKETPAKENSGLLDAPDVKKIVNRYFEAAGAELEASLSYASHRYPESPLDRVLAMGSGAGIAGLCEQFAARLSLPVEPIRPTDLVDCPKAFAKQGGDALATLALGLALYSE